MTDERVALCTEGEAVGEIAELGYFDVIDFDLQHVHTSSGTPWWEGWLLLNVTPDYDWRSLFYRSSWLHWKGEYVRVERLEYNGVGELKIRCNQSRQMLAGVTANGRRIWMKGVEPSPPRPPSEWQPAEYARLKAVFLQRFPGGLVGNDILTRTLEDFADVLVKTNTAKGEKA